MDRSESGGTNCYEFDLKVTDELSNDPANIRILEGSIHT